jgi:glyoxylase-like metal-dependent hydrolase (beta-lactamase superfamily II)
MHIERFFVPGLAHASYLVASGNEAVAVDPERNVGGYLAYLARNKLKLTGIFLTHPHADFVAGHAELSERSGASIFVSEKAPATFVHCDLKEGDRLAVGTLEIEVIETPGHSPAASVCLCSNPVFPLLYFPVTHFSPVTWVDRICAIGRLVRTNSRPCSTIRFSISC